MPALQSTFVQATTPSAIVTIPLTVHHLRFTVRAETPIVFHEFKGSALRGALVGTLRRTFCPEWRAEQTDPLHQAVCPVCQLLSIEATPEEGGDIRRPYALRPPLTKQNHFAPGESFSFGLTLFGDTLAYLPYLVLAVHAMGEAGVGRRDERGRRGRFSLTSIEAVHPLRGESLSMWTAGATLVQAQTLPVTHEDVLAASDRLAGQLATHDNRLTVQFRTPLRLTKEEHTVKAIGFFPLIKHAARRLLDLCIQYSGGRPDVVLREHLFPAADKVELVEDRCEWWDVSGFSGRLGREQKMGGLVGAAVYRAADWRPLLPWLVWGESTQVGKNVVKGCGIYQLSLDEVGAVGQGGVTYGNHSTFDRG